MGQTRSLRTQQGPPWISFMYFSYVNFWRIRPFLPYLASPASSVHLQLSEQQGPTGDGVQAMFLSTCSCPSHFSPGLPPSRSPFPAVGCDRRPTFTVMKLLCGLCLLWNFSCSVQIFLPLSTAFLPLASSLPLLEHTKLNKSIPSLYLHPSNNLFSSFSRKMYSQYT